MTAKDVIHSFWVPQFRQKQDLLPDQDTHLVITPTQTGAPSFPNSLTEPPAGSSEAIRDYVYLPADKLLNPYNVQFSFGVQRELFKDWTLTADVIRSRTLKQQRVNDINAPAPFLRTAPGQTRSAAAADGRRDDRRRPILLNENRQAVCEDGAVNALRVHCVGLEHEGKAKRLDEAWRNAIERMRGVGKNNSTGARCERHS